MNPQTSKLVSWRGVHFLQNQIGKDGKFVYQRNAFGDIIKGEYNILRHAGCIWAINTVFANYSSTDLVDTHKVDKAWAYLYNKVYVDRKTDAWYIMDKDNAKAGANALAILACLSMRVGVYPEVKHLTLGMTEFLDEVGNMVKSKFNPHTKEVSPFVSEYYPGEVALALCATGNYYAAAKVIYALSYSRDAVTPLPDHWALQAIEKLMEQDVEKVDKKFLVEYATQICEKIINTPASYMGRTCAMACRVEGLLAGYKITDNKGYLYFSEMVLRELIKYQNNIGTHPCFGGFFDNKEKAPYRIDYTQHAISAFNTFHQIQIQNGKTN